MASGQVSYQRTDLQQRLGEGKVFIIARRS